MRELHESRTPEALVKELVQNAFDEDSATACSVQVSYIEAEGVKVVVSDDGAGFANPTDSYELMGRNDKRGQYTKRGRFNLGDKEVLSVAVWARIQTVGYTIDFPESGGRVVKRNRRKKGTVVTVMMPWSEPDAVRLTGRLRRIRPPEGCSYRVNRKRVEHSRPLEVHEATLRTVIQGRPGEPMRPTRRKTALVISTPADKDGGWIYEMGIPIQPIEVPYDVDVQQKVPMPPNRDTVSEEYLQDIYSETLNAMHDDMRRDEFSETWVRSAVEDGRVSEDAAKSTLKNRYGDKVVAWSSDRGANLDAIDNGYEVLHPRSMSKAEREHLRERGGLQSASVMFGQPDGREADKIVDISGDPVKREFAEWVRRIGEMAGLRVKPTFIHNPKSSMLASCTMSTKNPTMRFNTARLKGEFFEGRGVEQLRLVIHELGHAVMDGVREHGRKWGDGCAEAGALITLAMDEKSASRACRDFMNVNKDSESARE